MKFYKIITVCIILFFPAFALAGKIKMCEQNQAEDPGNYLQFSLDETENLIIFFNLDGTFETCNYEALHVASEYTHFCEIESSDKNSLKVNIKFHNNNQIFIDQFEGNGPYSCRD